MGVVMCPFFDLPPSLFRWILLSNTLRTKKTAFFVNMAKTRRSKWMNTPQDWLVTKSFSLIRIVFDPVILWFKCVQITFQVRFKIPNLLRRLIFFDDVIEMILLMWLILVIWLADFVNPVRNIAGRESMIYSLASSQGWLSYYAMKIAYVVPHELNQTHGTITQCRLAFGPRRGENWRGVCTLLPFLLSSMLDPNINSFLPPDFRMVIL